MTDEPKLYERFKRAVLKLYEANRYELLDSLKGIRSSEVDLLLKSPKGESVVGEVRLFRTRVVARGELIRLIQSLDRYRNNLGIDKGLLVVGSTLGIKFADTGKVDVVDVPLLMEMTQHHPEIALELEQILRESTPMASVSDVLSANIYGDAVGGSLADIARQAGMLRFDVSGNIVLRSDGEALENALRAVTPGRDHFRDLEIHGLEALKYVFEGHLANWAEQRHSGEGISRFDVVARIISNEDFWKYITAFFRTLYVVFDFKNHTKPITKHEIQTTANYLYKGPLRMVGFTISPLGPDDNAKSLAEGFLRADGKLIINLTVNDICKMIRVKDGRESGPDANSYLFDLLDGMMLNLER